MTKVWIVSGIVLVGTGLALAGFGAWLAGNSNCDAGDFGRSCAVASLSVSVIGLALAGGGWMRVRRLEGAGADGEEAGGFLERRPGLVVIALSVLGLILLAVVFPSPRLPVNVYAGAAPDIATDPGALVFGDFGALNITDINVAKGEGGRSTVAEAGIVGGAFVRVTRFNAHLNWTPPPPPLENGTPEYNESRRIMIENASVENATAAAHAYLDAQYSGLNPAEGGRQCQPGAPKHWFSQSGEERSALAWAWGTFVIEVSAPTPALRDAAAAEIAAGPG